MRRGARGLAIFLSLAVAVASLLMLHTVHAGTRGELRLETPLDHLEPGLAYVTLSGSNVVAGVDAASYTVPITIDVGAAGCEYPWRAALAPGGHALWVSCRWSHSVVLIDTESHSVVDSVAGIEEANGVAFTWDGSRALVGSRFSGRLTVVDTSTLAPVHINVAAAPRSVAAHPYRDLAYAALANGNILVLNTETLAIVTTIPFGADVWDVALSPDGQWLYASDRWGAGLAVVDTGSNSIHTTVTGLGQLNGIDVAPDGSAVYVGQLHAGVHVVETGNFTVAGFATVPNTPWEMAATCDGSRLLVGNVSNEVVVVDTATEAVVSVPLPGAGSRGVTACAPSPPTGARIYPQPAQAEAAPGATASFALTLVHLEQEAMSYDLTLPSADWPASLTDTTVGPLAFGEEASFAVEVAVPADANWLATGQTVVSATSTTDGNVSAGALLATVAYAAPDVSVSPPSLNVAQTAAEVTTHTLSVENGHGVTSTFDVVAYPGTFTSLPGPAAAGGPDDFGYTYRDSQQIDGPRYAWEDIADSGTAVAVAGTDDTYFGPIPLNFSFDFYGNVYEEVFVSSNGYLTFGEGWGYIPYGIIPDTSGPNNMVALFGGDMYFAFDSALYYETRQNPTRTVLMFVNVHYCCGVNTPHTFEVVLYPDGNIVAQYQSLNETSSSYVGIENVDGTVGLAYEGTLSDSLAICYAYPGNRGDCSTAFTPWLTANPDTGTLAPNSAEVVEIVMDARGLQPGTHTADVVIYSDDPDGAAVVPVSMEVSPTATMGRVSGIVVDAWSGTPVLGTVRLLDVYTSTASASFTIWAEPGTYELEVSAPGYVSDSTGVLIESGEVTEITVALEPAQPRLELAVEELTAITGAGSHVTHSLTISNNGPMPLEVSLFELATAGQPLQAGVENLDGARIVMATAHGGSSYDFYTVIEDLEAAGATVLQQVGLIDDADLQGVDVLWVNCCGSEWSATELSAVSSWLEAGGAVFVQGPISSSVTQVAALFDIQYGSTSCTSGSTTVIGPHPITRDVDTIYLDSTCAELLGPAGTTALVADSPQERPRVVARSVGAGRMVVSASGVFYESVIYLEQNRQLARNTFAWLATSPEEQANWLSFAPDSLTIDGHSSATVQVHFDSTGLALGVYEAIIALGHNDPNRPALLEIPVTLRVAEIEHSIFMPFIAGRAP